ncbi:MAG: MarC family protein [Nitrospirota bacterium]|jgi:multiple antibiotic resistance protein
MEHWSEYTRFLTALIVILDPLAAVPLFLGLTAGLSAERRRRAVVFTVLTVVSVLVAAALLGDGLLRVMGTSLASFRVGGGIVLLLMALAMLRGQPDPVRGPPAEATGEQESVAVVPLGIPLLAGPGAISTVIIEMDRSTTPLHLPLVILCIVATGALLWLTLRLAVPIGARLGRLGLDILHRLLGLLLTAIAVEIMANGVRALFPALRG